MLAGKRFVIWGLSRLSVRVAQRLALDGASVIAVCLPDESDTLLPLLGANIEVQHARAEADGDTLRAAGLVGAHSLLALSENDLANLRAAVAARATAPDIPVVLRAFDPLLAERMEAGHNVRRAYSVSALAAPAFIAAACGDQVLETLRLAEGEVPICRLTVRTGSPLIGLTATEMKSRFGCTLLARSSAENNWQEIAGESARLSLIAGEQILLGGPRESVLRAVTRNSGWRKTRQSKQCRPSRPHSRRLTRLPQIAVALASILIVSVFVFHTVLHLSPVDSVYFVITTATTTGYGDISLKDSPDWLKLFGGLVMLTGGALLGILFSYLAAIATAERLSEDMSRRASRLSGHIIVAGLGNLGYRVARYLLDLGLDVVVVTRAPNERFADPLRPRAPILNGDASLPETLEQASITSAIALIACTSDQMANVQSCLHARHANPQIVTVARIFDDALTELSQAFAIDHAMSASQAAVSAFVGAATDELALRPLSLGSLSFLAGRLPLEVPLTMVMLDAWRAQGVRLLAFREKSGTLCAPSDLALPLVAGSELILCGPDAAIRSIIQA